MENLKEIIVVIKGANYLRSDLPWVQNFLILFYKILNVVPVYTKENDKWLNFIEAAGREVIYFEWSGLIWPKKVNQAARELAMFLEEKGPVKIISTSLGAQVALKALAHTKNITKIVSLSGVYTPRPVSVPFIDISSKNDHLANIGRVIFGFMAIPGRMERKKVILDNMRHDQFCSDTLITSGAFEGFTISGLINHFI